MKFVERFLLPQRFGYFVLCPHKQNKHFQSKFLQEFQRRVKEPKEVRLLWNVFPLWFLDIQRSQVFSNNQMRCFLLIILYPLPSQSSCEFWNTEISALPRRHVRWVHAGLGRLKASLRVWWPQLSGLGQVFMHENLEKKGGKDWKRKGERRSLWTGTRKKRNRLKENKLYSECCSPSVLSQSSKVSMEINWLNLW